MDTLFQINKDLPTPANGVRVIKASDYKNFLEAKSIIDFANQRAAQILEDAQTQYKLRMDEGYQEGIEQGKLEHSEKMMETILASVEFIENIERTVASVVTQSVEKIIGEIDDNDRIVRIVHQALNSVRGHQRVTVRVSPDEEPAVSKSLAAMTNGDFMTVIGDPRLENGRCILESELGVVDASLQTQLAAIANSIKAKIEE